MTDSAAMPTAPRLDPPRAVRDIAARLEGAGFETWCVGGAVRDALLGQAHLDWDLATAATPDQVRSLFKRTVPVGIAFGTIGVLDRKGVMHEVTTFRRDVRTDGRHAEVEFGVSLDDDLARRDFTINAIAFSPRSGVLHDPFHGQDDLAAGVVRAVGVPDERMREDRLRALRALRFAGRFGFEIEQATWAAIAGSAPFLTRLSPERVHQELSKTMEQVRCPSRSLALWRSSGALASLMPPLVAASAFTLTAADFVGAPERTSHEALSGSRRVNRLTTLFLDLDAGQARSLARDLRCSNREVDWFAHAVACRHELEPRMRTALEGAPPVPGAELRHWVARTGRTRFRDVLRVIAARWDAEREAGAAAPSAARVASLYRRGLRAAFRDPVALADLAIDGADLQEIGVPSGPRVGEVLRQLLTWVLDDPARNTHAALESRARALQAGYARSGEEG